MTETCRRLLHRRGREIGTTSAAVALALRHTVTAATRLLLLILLAARLRLSSARGAVGALVAAMDPMIGERLIPIFVVVVVHFHSSMFFYEFEVYVYGY